MYSHPEIIALLKISSDRRVHLSEEDIHQRPLSLSQFALSLDLSPSLK